MENNHRFITAAKQAVRQRNYRRARDRALARLSKEYPDTYLEFLEKEKERDEAMGKTWLNLNGDTNASLGITTDSPNQNRTDNIEGRYSE